MVSTIPVASTVSIFKTNEDSKERILFTLQIAVKQIQHFFSLQNEEDVLSVEVHEVKQLCESLDTALFHGLKSFDKGYWRFVKEFTHKNTVKFLEKLENIDTDIQCGRAWLCLALNESSLESYFRSFLQNTKLIKKYYDSPALLCDEQRMQLVLMLAAGLEFIPISLNVEEISYGCGLSFFEKFSNSLPVETEPSNYCMKELTKSSVQESVPFDGAEEVTGDFTVTTETKNVECKTPVLNVVNLLHKLDSVEKNIGCKDEDLERISHYINIDADTAKVDGDLEVIRSKVVRRTKRSVGSKDVPNDGNEAQNCCSDLNIQPNGSDNSRENRLSKATTDSGLYLETPCSSDSECVELSDEVNSTQDFTRTFESAQFHQDINITFSVPPKSIKDLSEDIVEKRGNPEGQEDPKTGSGSQCDVSVRLPLLPGNDGMDDKSEEEEEEVSIYDLCKPSYLDKSEANDSQSPKSHQQETAKDILLSCVKKQNYVDDVSDEIAKLLNEKSESLDFRVGNNVLLYFLVEIYEHEEENFYKLYGGFLNFSEGSYQKVYFLLSNKSIYFLKAGNSQQKFFKYCSLRYSSIDYITVDLNYQGFKIISGNKDHFHLDTADEELTRNILSSLEIGIRRFIPRLPLPSVYTDSTSRTIVLKKFLSSVLNYEQSEVQVQHYALARWEDYTSSSITPSGPIYQDYLMYRHKFVDENKTTPWQPGYFLLKAGVLYCMEDEKSKPSFFIQMCTPHCQGCRRIHLLNRPNAFEIIRSNSYSLQLAAADSYEASKWLQCFLETVSLAGHFIDTEKNVQKASCILFSNDTIIIAQEIYRKCTFRLLGKAKLSDLVTVFVDPLADTCLMLEFEIAEATKSCGEWIIYFESVLEKEKFMDVIRQRWSEIFQVSLSVEVIKDLFLLKKCRLIAEDWKADKSHFRDYCSDD
ncbi:pleckstrin homology domain-containing family M member 2-like [Uloborus diversus]|uniref:pleckstrin homology domain-containing family M member 2-like n=1 Tax=Uloborus diversus TaxID=327109 RepID=UPI002409B1A4|nr:pleckstrin homology domain-containing family M member 2-like [Uloborus diversus]